MLRQRTRLLGRDRRRRALKALLPQLPAAQRQVFLLRDVEGVAAGEVRELLRVSEGNQRVLLHRARSRLRGMLEREIGRV